MSRDGPSDIENQTAGPVPLPHRTDGLGCTPLGGPGSTAKVPRRMRSSYLCGSSVPSNVTGQRSTAWHALRALRAWIARVRGATFLLRASFRGSSEVGRIEI